MHSHRSILRDRYQWDASIPAGGASSQSAGVSDSAHSDLQPDFLLFVEAPALSVTELPNGQTITYQLLESNSSNLSSPTDTIAMGVQTGAGGVGAAAAIVAARRTYSGKYFGLKITASATANASGYRVPLRTALTASPGAL